MRRLTLIASLVGAAALLAAPGAVAAGPPTLGPVSATDLQGVSAHLVGTVNPNGSSTTYHFEYVDQATFAGSSFAKAVSTQATSVGSGSTAHPAAATITGLKPSTAYHYRLVATSTAGTTTGTGEVLTTTAGFGFQSGTNGFSVFAPADGGEAASLAGLHPYQLNLHIGLNQGGEFEGQPGVHFPDGDMRDLHISMPPGLILNPNALPKCSLVSFHEKRESPFETGVHQNRSGENCPDNTQVGTVEVNTSLGGGVTRRFGLFNLEPPPGVTAELGFSPFGSPIVFEADVHTLSDGSYTLSLDAGNISQSLDFYGLNVALWGIPWNPSHNVERGNCLNEAEPTFGWCKHSVGEPEVDPPVSYVSLPAICQGPMTFIASADAWQQPGEVTTQAQQRDSKGNPVPEGGCGGLNFTPHTESFLTDVKASSASGFEFRLSNDNTGFLAPNLRAPSQAKTAIVSPPAGVTINPSLGAGLIGCAPNQYAAETAFSPQGAGCPNGSKIGDFRVRSPLFDELINGAIYLATPDNPTTTTPGAENPFDTLIAVYLVAKLPERGILIKLAGKIVPDPGTGRLTATFDGLPQLPYTELEVNFRAGQRAPLITPTSCGPASTTTTMVPWAVGPPNATGSNSSQIEHGIGGGPCPTGAAPPYTPHVVAGGINSNVNSYTPYFIHISRQDTEQEITSYSLILPKGITGKLAGIPFCPEADIERARTRQGYSEAAEPSCPAASQVGRTVSGYGVGSALTYATGRVYLAGPYHGAPLSLVTINSATVGPFDLGTIVIRSAFQVDPLTAQLRIDSSASDPIPHILDGVPLHLRDIRIYMDRPEFTHNPSSCAPSELISTLGGSGASFESRTDDSLATATSYFQLLNCLTLHFKPKLGLRMRGGTKRRAYPELRATFAARGPGDSNLKEIGVTIPHQEFLAQEHISGICTKVQFNTGKCPADSIYGSAVAYTPLLDEPLRGNVYLRTNPKHAIPDLVASLYSGAVNIVLEGRIGPGKKGGIEAFFSELPDQPLERFVMTLEGGKHGLLQNSADICAVPPVASVKALAQNNIGATFSTKLRGQCGGKGGKKRTKRHGDGGGGR
jgi:hypothetical protein